MTVWRKSSYSNPSGNCIEINMEEVMDGEWRKASYSNSFSNCVEVRADDLPDSALPSAADYVRDVAAELFPAVQVRDSKDPSGPVLAFPPEAWAAFAAGVKDAGRMPG